MNCEKCSDRTKVQGFNLCHKCLYKAHHGLKKDNETLVASVEKLEASNKELIALVEEFITHADKQSFKHVVDPAMLAVLKVKAKLTLNKIKGE